MLFGLVGTAVSAISLGLSTTFQAIVISRSLLGLLNANYTILRSSMGDVLNQTDFALVNFDSRQTQTLPSLKTYNPSSEAYQLLENGNDPPRLNNINISSGPTPPLRSLLSKRLVLLLATNMINTFLEAAVTTILPVILATPVENGGFGMSPSEIGLALALLGIFSGLLLILFFARLHTRLGNKNLLRVGLSGYVGLFAIFAAVRGLTRVAGDFSMFLWPVLVVLCIFFTASLMVANCFTLLLADGTPPDSLGAVNGLSQTAGAITRTAGPMTAGFLLTLSLEKHYLDGNLAYYILSGIALCGFIISGYIPSTRPSSRRLNIEHFS
ncbi:hypothetical protein Clacol_005163 [Clathrus columnatus]|uniref:Major facilitator superfamily (MFS) profile domain-containing protein n=1 Tax=Clathrus columnatus TaxID=1419009 RepID=A0AAV5A8J2_9AGAM|nr:hypothetical protein Clacol_005163 [Clathrus columnatus]